jgi:hypothetical protein
VRDVELVRSLGAARQVFVSNPKEAKFFCKDEIFQRRWTGYQSLFAGSGERIAIG